MNLTNRHLSEIGLFVPTHGVSLKDSRGTSSRRLYRASRLSGLERSNPKRSTRTRLSRPISTTRSSYMIPWAKRS
jgi:hypothetical protein